MNPAAGERYRTGDELGRGGVGVVYRGLDTTLGREVALKVLREEQAAVPAVVRRFVEEAQIGGQLQHPGIVPVYDLSLLDERPLLAMKLVAGRTLDHLIGAAQSDGDRAHLLSVFRRVAATVAYAHSRGVVHRDLKPANVMIGELGEVHVIDWGMSKVLVRELGDEAPPIATVRTADGGSRSVAGSVMGTFAYMPPEQALGEVDRVDERADVFALGGILCEILTGQPPYEGDAEQARERARRAELGPARARLRSAIADPELVALALGCLEPAAAKRPRTAATVSDQLAEHAASVQRRLEESRLASARAGERRRAARRLLWLALGLIVIVGVSAVVAMLAWREADRERRDADVQAGLARAAEELERSARGKADASLARYDMLANVARLRDARAAEPALYPAWPSNRDRLQAWLTRFGDPLERALQELRGALVALRREARPWSSAERTADRRTEEAELARARQSLAPYSPSDERHAALRRLLSAERFDRLAAFERSQLAKLEAARGARRTWSFAKERDRFLHDTMALLIADLQLFVHPQVGRLHRVRRALAWSRRVVSESIDRHRDAWERARREIRSDPRYGGLDLAPQLGLVPLGRDPHSGLEEFVHIGSGVPGRAIPRRSRGGRLELTSDHGIVLVLLPSARFFMGAQKVDAAAPNFDPAADPTTEQPVHEVELDAHFFAKHEVTQAQYGRVFGRNPSGGQPGSTPAGLKRIPPTSTLHPVERVDWHQATAFARRHGLELPTEAQWEHGCRAGTDTPWCTGVTPATLAGHANLRDRTHASVSDARSEAFDDGRWHHAPIASYSANPFGIHDMHGNVDEWCRDRFSSYGKPVRAGDGLRERSRSELRVVRSGSYHSGADDARSANRQNEAATSVDSTRGFRVVRRVISE